MCGVGIELFAFYALIVALASFNRETGLVLVFLFIAYFPARWRQGVLLFLVYASITAAIHLAMGSSPHMLGLDGTLRYNLDNLNDALLTNVLFVPLWAMVVLNYRAASPIFRRLVWVAVAYLLAIAVGGAWNETARLILPIMPLILPVWLGDQYAL